MLAWKPSIFPVVSFGMGGLGPNISWIYWEARPKKNHWEKEIWRKNNWPFFFPKVFGESSGEQSGLKTPSFSLWFPLAWVTWNLKFPNSMGRMPIQGTQATQAKGNLWENWGFSTQIFPELSSGILGENKGRNDLFFQRCLGRAQWENLDWNPLSLWFPLAWVAWGRNSLVGPPPRPPKIWRPCPWEFSGSKSIGRRRPPKPRKLKVTTRKKGGFTAQIFPWAPPKEFWTTKCWLENPSIFPVVSFGLGGLHPTQAKGNHSENWGFSTQIFPQSSFQGPCGKRRSKMFFFCSQRSLERAVEKFGLKPPVPVVSFELGGLGASSQWIFGIFGPLESLHVFTFFATLAIFTAVLLLPLMDLHCWAHVPDCLHAEGTLTWILLNVGGPSLELWWMSRP